MAVIVILDFQSICEQNKLSQSMHTNGTVCTQFQVDWTT